MIRVLIVDDSLVAQRAVSEALQHEVDFEVLPPASSGPEALDRILGEGADVVVLDVQMPDMDGFEVLDQIRVMRPQLPVIMFSAVTEKGAAQTLDALARGAADVLAKPSNTSSQHSFSATMGMLAAKVRTLGSLAQRPRRRRQPEEQHAPQAVVDAVVIGVSTGGPNALMDLIPRLPSDFAVPVLIVIHMPPVFTRQFAERLDSRSRLHVREATHGEEVTAGTVLIAPGGRHMSIEARDGNRVIALDDGPAENSCRPAADVLFRSAANCYGDHTLGLVLTGMGHDGLLGSEAIVKAGGTVIAQDEPSSVVWGMPGSVVRHGFASKVAPLPMIAGELERRVAASRTAVAGADHR